MTTLFLTLLLAAQVSPVQAATPSAPTAPVFHVVSIQDHTRGRDEPSYASAAHTRIYKGTIGDKTFTLEEAIALFSPGSRFQVGHDYMVDKMEDRIGKTIKIVPDPDKKGKNMTAWLTVKSVEETPK